MQWFPIFSPPPMLLLELTYTDVPVWFWFPPASMVGCLLLETPWPLARMSRVRDFPTFRSSIVECRSPIELSSKREDDKETHYFLIIISYHNFFPQVTYFLTYLPIFTFIFYLLAIYAFTNYPTSTFVVVSRVNPSICQYCFSLCLLCNVQALTPRFLVLYFKEAQEKESCCEL